MRGLGRDDDDLLAYLTQVMMQADREPASREAMELSFLELKLAVIETRIATAEGDGASPPVELQRIRAELTEEIARAQS